MGPPTLSGFSALWAYLKAEVGLGAQGFLPGGGALAGEAKVGERNELCSESHLNLIQTCHLEVAHLCQGVCDAGLHFPEGWHKDLGKCAAHAPWWALCTRTVAVWGWRGWVEEGDTSL